MKYYVYIGHVSHVYIIWKKHRIPQCKFEVSQP